MKWKRDNTLGLWRPGDTQCHATRDKLSNSCCHSHFTLQQVTPEGIWWLPFYPSTCCLWQVTGSKLLRRSHMSEQHNLTTCLSEEVNWNSFSLDWGSALNSSTVLGDLSDSSSPRTSSDWFFREWIVWGRRWSTRDRKNAWDWLCKCTSHAHILKPWKLPTVHT